MIHSRMFIRSTCIAVCLLACAYAQESNKRVHSWDVLMNQPGAREAAKKLRGHCGDAETQDVMNACFALGFKDADERMNTAYRATLRNLDKAERLRVRAAQRAWLRYRELHCGAVAALWEGGSLQPTQFFACNASLTTARTKEIQSDYSVP